MSTIAERVAAGAAFLDEHDPGWDQRIALALLDLSDCDACILGQLWGGYGDGLAELDLGDQQTKDLGFKEAGLLKSHCNYPALTAEWRRVIEARRAAP